MSLDCCTCSWRVSNQASGKFPVAFSNFFFLNLLCTLTIIHLICERYGRKRSYFRMVLLFFNRCSLFSKDTAGAVDSPRFSSVQDLKQANQLTRGTVIQSSQLPPHKAFFWKWFERFFLGWCHNRSAKTKVSIYSWAVDEYHAFSKI